MKLGNNKRIIIYEIPDFRDTCTFIYIARLNIVILSAKQSCLKQFGEVVKLLSLIVLKLKKNHFILYILDFDPCLHG